MTCKRKLCRVVRKWTLLHRRHAYLSTLFLLAMMIALGGYLVWMQMYPGYTLRGFASNIKVILPPFLLVLMAALPALGIVIPDLRNGTSSFHGINNRFRRPPYTSARCAICLLCVILLTGCVFLDSPSFCPDFVIAARDHNWELASEELRKLKKQPYTQDRLKALELYLEISRKRDLMMLSGTSDLRAKARQLDDLLKAGVDPHGFTLRAYVLASREIHRNERDTGDCKHLTRPYAHILKTLRRNNDADTEALALDSLGLLELTAQNYIVAMACFDRSADVARDKKLSSLAKGSSGICWMELRQANRAIETLEVLEVDYPSRRVHILFSNIGCAYLLAGNYTEAKKASERALKIREDDWESYINLGLALVGLGQFDDAIASYNKIIEQEGKLGKNAVVSHAHIHTGIAMEKKGLNASEFLWHYALAIDPDFSDSELKSLVKDDSRRANIYWKNARILLDANTYGNEPYITWLRTRAKEYDPRCQLAGLDLDKPVPVGG